MQNELARSALESVREYKTAHIVIRVDTNGPSTEQMAALASDLDATRVGFVKLIGAGLMPREPVYVDLYLQATSSISPHEADSGATRLADPLLRITGTPNEPPESLKRALIRLLLLAAFGEQAGRAEFLIDGIYGFLALDSAEAKVTTVSATLARALTRKQATRAASSSSILERILAGPTVENRRYYADAVTSFTAYLIGVFGEERFREFARRVGPTNAAMVLEAVYGHTIASLDREWRNSLPTAPAPRHGFWWVVGRALVYWRPYWITGLLIAGTVCLQDYFLGSFSNAIQQISDVVNAKDPKELEGLGSLVLALSGQLALLYCIAVAAAVVQNYLTARASSSILNDLRLKMFAQLQRLSMRYYTQVKTGDVVAHFTSDLTDVDKGLTSRLPDGFFSIIGITWWSIQMYVQDGRIAFVMLLVMPLLVLSTRLFAQPTVDATYRLKRQQAALASVVQENVKAQPVIKIFALQDTSLARLQTLLSDLWRTAFRANFLGQTMGTASALAVTLLTVAFPLVGAIMVVQGMMSPSGLFASYVLFGLITGEAYNLTKKVIPTLLSATGAMTRIDELLAVPVEVIDEPNAVAISRPSKDLMLEDVSFSYDRERPILDHVSLRIPVGQFIGLVGPSGSGKSTILNLLMRFYDPTVGTVSIDGYNLRRVTQESLREHMAAVFQDTFLFDVPIRENIRMGALNASDEAIVAAAKDAEIHDLINSLPDGYESRTGEMGSLLSGGQRQRLAIARAIVRDPAILLLDEPTSALDPATETAIMRTIERLAKQRTVIAVTHRLASVEHADTIVVLEAGRIQEQGTHAELLARAGLYHDLWQKQHGIEVSPDGRQATLQMSRLQAMPLFEVPLFAKLDARVLTLLASQFNPVHCQAGTVVAQQGEPAKAFYLVARGRMEVLVTDANLEERRVGMLEDGDFFGEVALLADTIYGATLRTLQDSLILSLQRDRFLNLVANLPELRLAIERASDSYRVQGTVGASGPDSTIQRRFTLRP